MPSLSEIHLVGDTDYLHHAFTHQMISLSDHPAHLRESSEASRLCSAKREVLECGTIRLVSSDVERTSYLKVRSPRDSRIQPHPKNSCRAVSKSWSFSFSESEYEGRASSPVLIFARSAMDTQKHPSPSVRPVTYHGSSVKPTP